MVSGIHAGNRGDFTLVYDHKHAAITLRHGDHVTTVLRIPAGFDPRLVGAEGDIRFLPVSLQPYLPQGKLLLTVAVRTTGGDGGGECGAGVEEYLKIVDVAGSVPRVIASHLIGSCAEPVELDNDGGQHDLLQSFQVAQGAIQIRFLSYRDEPDGPFLAHLSPDFQHLQFQRITNDPPAK